MLCLPARLLLETKGQALAAEKQQQQYCRGCPVCRTIPHARSSPCREFLRTKMAGLLQVTIQRATALPAADPSPFSSDP